LPVQNVRGGTTPLRRIKRLNRISWILGNIAVFVSGIPFIEKYDRLGAFNRGRFAAFTPK
jgi:hypothetical protein